MFMRPPSGRNFAGMLAHVFLPMMTAFRAPCLLPSSATWLVTLRKYAISPFSLQGNPPSLPMPLASDMAATIANLSLPMLYLEPCQVRVRMRCQNALSVLSRSLERDRLTLALKMVVVRVRCKFDDDRPPQDNKFILVGTRHQNMLKYKEVLVPITGDREESEYDVTAALRQKHIYSID